MKSAPMTAYAIPCRILSAFHSPSGGRRWPGMDDEMKVPVSATMTGSHPPSTRGRSHLPSAEGILGEVLEEVAVGLGVHRTGGALPVDGPEIDATGLLDQLAGNPDRLAFGPIADGIASVMRHFPHMPQKGDNRPVGQ